MMNWESNSLPVCLENNLPDWGQVTALVRPSLVRFYPKPLLNLTNYMKYVGLDRHISLFSCQLNIANYFFWNDLRSPYRRLARVLSSDACPCDYSVKNPVDSLSSHGRLARVLPSDACPCALPATNFFPTANCILLTETSFTGRQTP